jgi:hypothetical protein
MITIEPNNCAKAEVAVPARWESIRTQTSYVAQFNHEPRSFYAKQTQFPKSQMNVTFYEHNDYRNLRLSGQRKNKPNFEPDGFYVQKMHARGRTIMFCVEMARQGLKITVILCDSAGRQYGPKGVT